MSTIESSPALASSRHENASTRARHPSELGAIIDDSRLPHDPKLRVRHSLCIPLKSDDSNSPEVDLIVGRNGSNGWDIVVDMKTLMGDGDYSATQMLGRDICAALGDKIPGKGNDIISVSQGSKVSANMDWVPSFEPDTSASMGVRRRVYARNLKDGELSIAIGTVLDKLGVSGEQLGDIQTNVAEYQKGVVDYESEPKGLKGAVMGALGMLPERDTSTLRGQTALSYRDYKALRML